MKAIVFDLDDTLYDLMGPFALSHEELFSGKVDTPVEELFMLSRIYSDEAFYQVERGEITQEDSFIYQIEKTYEHEGLVVTPDQARYFEERYRYHQRRISLPEESMEILNACIQAKVPIYLLTNGIVKNQEKKFKALDIYQWFPKDHIFVSEELPLAKPAKIAFDTVAKKIGAKPEELCYVGDAYTMDIMGAKNAGWHAIWFNHRHREPEDGQYEPDIVVDTYQELQQKIQDIIKTR